MGSALELLTGILILVNSAKDGNDFLLRGKGDRAGDGRAVALCRLDDLLRSGVDELMIIGLQANSDHFVCHVVVSSLKRTQFSGLLGTVEALLLYA